MALNVGPLNRVVWKNIKLFKAAWKEAQKKLIHVLRGEAALEPIPIPVRQPLPTAARIRQGRSQYRWFSTQVLRRTFTTSTPKPQGIKYDRSTYPKSNTASAISKLPGRAPFASTLRPNLTGGALHRTAGGYSLGGGRMGGARYFSHTPAAPAQVVQNVGQAVRAFCLGGQKAQFAGTNARGEKRYRAVSSLQHETTTKMHDLPRATPGSFIEFPVNPTITALTPLGAVAGFSGSADAERDLGLNTEGLLDVLSTDFSRSLKDLMAVLSDLQRLSGLGDLPITYSPGEHGMAALRVHFPGCDADSVEGLCRELGISRGVVVQDEAFDAFAGTEMALLFPFAPSKTSASGTSDGDSYSDDEPYLFERSDNPWQRGRDRYSTLSEQSYSAVDAREESNPWAFTESAPRSSGKSASTLLTESHAQSDPLEYQDIEGIYRFIMECDAARGRQ